MTTTGTPAPLRIGLAGLGTVGAGTMRLLTENADLIARAAGRPLTVTAVSARQRHRDRGIDLSGYRWLDDPVALATDPEVDVVVELIGGEEGPSRALLEAALRIRQPAVTANKALLAPHRTGIRAVRRARPPPPRLASAVARR